MKNKMKMNEFQRQNSKKQLPNTKKHELSREKRQLDEIILTFVGLKCAKIELSNRLTTSMLSKSLDGTQEHADSGSPTHFTKYSSYSMIQSHINREIQ